MTQYKYQALAETLRQWIIQGELKAGKRMPSLRELTRQHQVSQITVSQAYALLESEGWVETRSHSGHYVGKSLPLQNAASKLDQLGALKVLKGNGEISDDHLVNMGDRIQRFFDAHHHAAAHHHGFTGFGTATPAPELLPAEDLYQCMKRLNTLSHDAMVAYDLPPGYEPLRQQLSVLSRQWGVPGYMIPARQFVITSGAMEAFHICLSALTVPGDLVIIENPTYFGILQALESHGLRAISLPADPETGLDLDLLKNTLHQYSARQQPIKACLLVPSFNNPLGSLMPPERRQQLSRLLQQYGIALIENDVYGDLYFGPERPPVIQSYGSAEEEIYLCSSFTKTLAPGFRVGWIVAPPQAVARICQMKLFTSVGTSTLPQYVLASYLQGRRYARHLQRLRHQCEASVKTIRSWILDYFPEEIQVSNPQGGFVLWVGLPSHVDAYGVQLEAAKEGLLIAPGPAFSSTLQFNSHIRINCSIALSDVLEKKVEILGKILKKLALTAVC